MVSSEAETLDPRYAVDAVSHRITRLVHRGLVTLDPTTLEPKRALAESLRYVDDVTVDVTLVRDATFHSGKALTAADVVATLRALAAPAVHARSARVVEPIASVEETGPLSLRIHLHRPHATLETDLELPILRADEAFAPPRPDGSLDGLGPYRVSSMRSGEVALTPARGSSARSAVTVRTVRDENARALRLIAGRADVAVNVFSPSLMPAMAREGVHVATRPGANVTYLLLRADRAPFERLEARRAAALGVDRRRIVSGLLAGAASVATGALPPSLWAHADAAPLDFDGAAAGAAIRALGGLRFGLLTSPDRVRLSIARTIAQDMRDAGAEVEVTALELGSLLARLTAGDFDAAILNMPELTEPNVLRLFLHSASIPPAGTNRGRVRDAEIDRLLDLAAQSRGKDERRALYAALEARLRETHLFIPLWHEHQITVTSARTHGFLPSAEGRWLAIANY